MGEEESVIAATKRFYDALEQMMTGKGAGPIADAWHHTDRVSTAHPMGTWAHGWDEIAATWEVFASLGRPENAGSQVRDLKAHVYGDIAYTTGVFIVAPFAGSAQLNITNILHRVEGVWKIIHHHADKAPSIEASLEKLAESRG